MEEVWDNGRKGSKGRAVREGESERVEGRENFRTGKNRRCLRDEGRRIKEWKEKEILKKGKKVKVCEKGNL